MLGDFIREKLTLEVVLRYGSCKLVIVPVFPAKHCYSVFLRKNGNLGEFDSFLVVDWSVTSVCL